MHIKNTKKIFKTKKAQQLVEFLLIAPFLIILLGIVTEFAYALNVNMTLSNGLKKVTASIYSQIKPNMSASQINSLVKSDLLDYLKSNNVPTESENNLTVNYSLSGESAIFISTYRYYSAFTLPNVFFKILPEQFNFLATSSVPAAFLQGNSGYSSGVDSLQLDKIWSSGSDFSSLDSFNDSKEGIMQTSVGSMPSISTKILFLIPDPFTASVYYLTNFKGEVLSNCTLSTSTGKLTGAGCGVSYDGKPFLSYLKGNSYYNVIFVHDSTIFGSVTTANVQAAWTSGSGKLYETSVDGALKRALAIINSTSKSIGNFDNLNVSVYNGGFSANSYNIDTFGSIVFVYGASDSVVNIKGVATESNYGYSF